MRIIKLQNEHILKLSAALKVPADIINTLNNKGLLNNSKALDLILKTDFMILRNEGYARRTIIKALSNKYKVSTGKVVGAAYEKKKHECFCRRCGKRIPKTLFEANAGFCDSCVSDRIDVSVEDYQNI